MDKQELNEFISYNLHELAWKKNYPLNEEMSIWCFLEGLRKTGFLVNLHSDNFNIFNIFKFNRRNYELSTQISRKEISEGWGRYPKSSPQSLYDSICLVIDRLQDNLKNKYSSWKVPTDLANALFDDRQTKYKKARVMMEKHFLEFFEKYHEGVLASLNGNEQSYEPKILDKLIDSKIINLDRINEALRISQFGETGSRTHFSSACSTVKFLRYGEELDEDFLITQSNVEDYVWGSYLLELSKLKGYPMKKYDFSKNSYGMLEIACDKGWNILETLRK